MSFFSFPKNLYIQKSDLFLLIHSFKGKYCLEQTSCVFLTVYLQLFYFFQVFCIRSQYKADSIEVLSCLNGPVILFRFNYQLFIAVLNCCIPAVYHFKILIKRKRDFPPVDSGWKLIMS